MKCGGLVFFFFLRTQTRRAYDRNKQGVGGGGTWTLVSERYALSKKHQLCFAFAALRLVGLAQRTHTHTDAHAAT